MVKTHVHPTETFSWNGSRKIEKELKGTPFPTASTVTECCRWRVSGGGREGVLQKPRLGHDAEAVTHVEEQPGGLGLGPGGIRCQTKGLRQLWEARGKDRGSRGLLLLFPGDTAQGPCTE